MKKLFLALLLSMALVGCKTPSSTGERWVRSEVFFGLSKPDGSLVSTSEWQKFVDEVVTPKFPAGLSIFDTAGQWRDAKDGHVVHESSKMLVLLHPPGAEAEAKIDAIRVEYCKRFNQDSVMKVTTKARVAF